MLVTHTTITFFCVSNLVPVHDPVSLANEFVFANDPIKSGTKRPTCFGSDVKPLTFNSNPVTKSKKSLYFIFKTDIS